MDQGKQKLDFPRHFITIKTVSWWYFIATRTQMLYISTHVAGRQNCLKVDFLSDYQSYSSTVGSSWNSTFVVSKANQQYKNQHVINTMQQVPLFSCLLVYRQSYLSVLFKSTSASIIQVVLLPVSEMWPTKQTETEKESWMTTWETAIAFSVCCISIG